MSEDTIKPNIIKTNIIKPNTSGKFKYFGEQIPFPCTILNCGPQTEAQFIVTTHKDDLNQFQLHDSTYYSKTYFFVWSHNIAVIKNIGKSNIEIFGEGIFRQL